MLVGEEMPGTMMGIVTESSYCTGLFMDSRCPTLSLGPTKSDIFVNFAKISLQIAAFYPCIMLLSSTKSDGS